MADLTAPQLIALLREHPGACGMLGLTTNSVGTIEDVRVVAEGGRISLYGDDAICFAVDFGCWLTGAAVEKCDELDIEIVRYADGFGTIERQHVVATTGDIGHRMVIGKKHPTRLHAALAALEQHAKEQSNG